MPLPAINDLLAVLTIDNALLISEVASGQPGTATETLALVSQAKAVFSVATIVCRSYGLAADCAALWTSLARTFGEMTLLWQDVAVDDETVSWLRHELCRLLELASDRVEIYTVTKQERLEFARLRRPASNRLLRSRQRNRSLPWRWRQSIKRSSGSRNKNADLAAAAPTQQIVGVLDYFAGEPPTPPIDLSSRCLGRIGKYDRQIEPYLERAQSVMHGSDQMTVAR